MKSSGTSHSQVGKETMLQRLQGEGRKKWGFLLPRYLPWSETRNLEEINRYEKVKRNYT